MEVVKCLQDCDLPDCIISIIALYHPTLRTYFITQTESQCIENGYECLGCWYCTHIGNAINK